MYAKLGSKSSESQKNLNECDSSRIVQLAKHEFIPCRAHPVSSQDAGGRTVRFSRPTRCRSVSSEFSESEGSVLCSEPFCSSRRIS